MTFCPFAKALHRRVMDQNLSAKEQKSTYKKQTFLSLFQFSSEVVNFVIIAISAFTTQSLIMWQDLINSSGNTMRTGLTAAFSKKMTKDLRFEYNYGIGKAEAMISLFCDCFVFIGLVATFIFSIIELFTPKEASNTLIWAVGIKLVCVICDLPMVYFQYKIKKENNNRVANSGFIATVGAMVFDVAAFVSLAIVYFTRDLPGAQYVSPVLSILIAIYLLVTCTKHIIESISELTDKTLPEEEQMKILKVLTHNVDKFENFGNIKTRYNGMSVCVDICISFSAETQFSDIKALRDKLQEELSKVIEGCIVTIMIE